MRNAYPKNPSPVKQKCARRVLYLIQIGGAAMRVRASHAEMLGFWLPLLAKKRSLAWQ